MKATPTTKKKAAVKSEKPAPKRAVSARSKTTARASKRVSSETKAAPVKKRKVRKLNAQERAGRTTSAMRARAADIANRLEQAIPEARCELEFENPFELLIETILASQFTDKGVNALRPSLFGRFPNAKVLAQAPQSEVEAVIRTTGYYRQKARYIRETAKRMLENHNGEVPQDMDTLLTMPGVARKTANVVLGTAFGIPSGIVVDTHGIRVSKRLGLLGKKPRAVDVQPEQIEIRLTSLFPKETWIDVGHRLTLHGRYTCTAYHPKCGECVLRADCPSVDNAPPEPEGEEEPLSE